MLKNMRILWQTFEANKPGVNAEKKLYIFVFEKVFVKKIFLSEKLFHKNLYAALLRKTSAISFSQKVFHFVFPFVLLLFVSF